jgi:hypothetical protein
LAFLSDLTGHTIESFIPADRLDLNIVFFVILRMTNGLPDIPLKVR